MELPIDVIPGPGPLRFRWEWTVDTVVGPRTQVCEGSLASPIEPAVVALIGIARAQAVEVERLKEQLIAAADRIAAQSELLSKRAETPTEITITNPSTAVSQSSSSRDKGRRK